MFEALGHVLSDTWSEFQRLKAAVHYTVGRLCQKTGEEHQREFSRQVVAAIAETTFRQCGGCLVIKTFE